MYKRVRLAVSKTKKQQETWHTKQDRGEKWDWKNARGDVRAGDADIQVPTVNASSSSSSSSRGARGQHHGQQFHGMDNDIVSNDEVAARRRTDWTAPWLTLTFQLKGDVVELRLTRSRSQTSHGKVFVARRGRIRRWIPTSPNDVSEIVNLERQILTEMYILLLGQL